MRKLMQKLKREKNKKTQPEPEGRVRQARRDLRRPVGLLALLRRVSHRQGPLLPLHRRQRQQRQLASELLVVSEHAVLSVGSNIYVFGGEGERGPTAAFVNHSACNRQDEPRHDTLIGGGLRHHTFACNIK